MGNHLGTVPNLGCSLTGRQKKETQAAHQLPVEGLPMLSKDSWPIRIMGSVYGLHSVSQAWTSAQGFGEERRVVCLTGDKSTPFSGPTLHHSC